MCYCGHQQDMATWSHRVMRHCSLCIAIRRAVFYCPRTPIICELCKPFFVRVCQLYHFPASVLQTRAPANHEVCSACDWKVYAIFALGRQALIQSTLCYACAKFLIENYF